MMFRLYDSLSGKPALILIGLALYFASVSAQGATRYVAPGGSDGSVDTPNPCLNEELPCATIQHALEQAASGDTIQIAAGIYTEQITIDRSVTISGDGDADTIMQAHEDPGEANGRVITVDAAVDVTIEHIWIRHGVRTSFPSISNKRGAGVLVEGGTTTIRNSRISHNQLIFEAGGEAGLGFGAGVAVDDATLHVIDSEISDNEISDSSTWGGGIGTRDAVLTVTGSVIRDNGANATLTHGGGIVLIDTIASIANTEITGNQSTTFDSRGGGIFQQRGALTLDHVLIQNNQAPHDPDNPLTAEGGGVASAGIGTTLEITNSEILDNLSPRGAGLAVGNDVASVTITGSRIAGNIAPSPPGGGSSGVGGGIHLGRAPATITDTEVLDNEAGDNGGGIWLNSEVSLTNLIVQGNTAQFGGGGVYAASSSDLTITDSLVHNNTLTVDVDDLNFGGAGIRAGSHLEMTRTTVSGNTSLARGAGLYVRNGGAQMSVALYESAFRDNVSEAAGGGVRAHAGNGDIHLAISRSTFSDNTAATGAALSLFDNVPTTIVNSTFSGNMSTSDTGRAAISQGVNSDPVTIINATITDNVSNASSPGNRAAVHAGSTMTFVNSIVADQRGTTSGCSGSPSSDGHNLASDTSCGFTGPSDQQNGTANLGALANNGGSTLTHALLPGSDAIDAGNNTVCAGPDVSGIDQRGDARPQDGMDTGTATCDIGAFELEAGGGVSSDVIFHGRFEAPPVIP